MVIWGHVRGRKDNHSTFGWKWRNPQVSKVTAPFSSDGKKYRILQTFVTVNDPLKKRGEKKTPIKTHSRHLIRPVDPDFSLLVVFDTFLFLPESYSNLERRKNVISKDPSSHDPTRVNWQQNVYKPLFFFLSRVLFPFADQVWQQQQGLDHKDGVACQRQSKKRNIPIKVIRIFNNSPENGWGVMADNVCIPTHRDIESQRTRQQHSQSQHDEFRECHFWLLVNHQRVWRKRKNSFLWFQSNTHTRWTDKAHTHTHTQKNVFM